MIPQHKTRSFHVSFIPCRFYIASLPAMSYLWIMNSKTSPATEKTTSEKYIDGLSIAIDALYRGATAATIASVTGMVANMKGDLELPRIANRNDAYGRRVRKAMVAMIARGDNALKTSTAA